MGVGMCGHVRRRTLKCRVLRLEIGLASGWTCRVESRLRMCCLYWVTGLREAGVPFPICPRRIKNHESIRPNTLPIHHLIKRGRYGQGASVDSTQPRYSESHLTRARNMSYPRRTSTKSHTLQNGGADLTFTTISNNCNTTPFPSVPGPSTASPHLRRRTSSSSKRTPIRKRASSATAAPSPFQSQPFLFTPCSPPTVRPRNSSSNLGPPPPYTPFPLGTKSRSSSHLSQNISTATFLAQYTPLRMRTTQDASSDSDSDPEPLDEDEDSMIYTAKHLSNGVAFRSRIFPRHSKGITTAPGQLGAGETETEADEPVRTPFCATLFSILTCILSTN